MSRRELIKGGGKVTLVVGTVANGSVTINGQSGTEFKFKRKESVLIKATANPSYYVASLTVNGTNVSNPYTLVITENTTVIATMNIIAYGAITWDTAGDYGFTVPASIVRLRINVRGGGGGGGGGCSSTSGVKGGNGGTGGQAYTVIGVSPGQYFGVTVGVGGSGGGDAAKPNTAQSGANGYNSFFGDYGAPGGGGGGGASVSYDGADGTSFGGGADGGAGGRGANNGSAGGTGSVSVEWGARI